MNISNQPLVKQWLAMAQCAKAAYDRDSRITFANWGFDTNYQKISHKHTYVHVACNTTHIIIAFRGTNNRKVTDYLADADLWPHMDGKSWVHRGFKRRAEWLIPGIIRYINKHPDKSIYITGHSMGGAMALYTAYELERLNVNPITVFTYGCPRIGNREYVDLIRSTHHRFVNCNDIIPRIPLSIIGYKHHGTLHYLNYNGELTDFTHWQRIKDIYKARANALRGGYVFDWFHDHKMGSYIKKISRLDSIHQQMRSTSL